MSNNEQSDKEQTAYERLQAAIARAKEILARSFQIKVDSETASTVRRLAEKRKVTPEQLISEWVTDRANAEHSTNGETQ